MEKQFGTVEIFAFDLHTALAPLALKTASARFQFLADPALYRTTYKAANQIETKSFTIAPLSADAIRRHHLWSRYTSTQLVRDPDYWSLQMPLLCQPKNVDLKLSDPNLKGTVQASLWLFPLGWSTHLEIVLQDPMAEQDLKALTRSLHDGQPISLSGQPRKIIDVFRRLSRRLTDDVYQNFQGVNDMLRISRHLVISLGNYSGPVEAYKPGSATGMPPKVRALMHSILLGNEVSDQEVLSLEKNLEAPDSGKNKFLLTGLRAKNGTKSPDFGITYFDQGSLLLVQKGFSSKARRESFHCFGSNVRYFTMMALAWLAFESELRDLEPNPRRPHVPDLRPPHIKEIKPREQLKALKKRYKSRFSESFFRSHRALSGVG